MSDDTQTPGTALAERPAKPIDTVRMALERMKPQLQLALPKHLTPDRLVRVAMTAVQRTPKLLDCDRTSFYGAVMMAAQLGIEPDGILGQGYIIPYGKTAQFIPGYKGLITLARNSGEISMIAAHEVRENDQFDFDFGSGDPPTHKFKIGEERGEVIAFYAIARFKDGSFAWDMMPTREVDQIRDNSTGYQSAKRYAKNGVIDSPWVNHYVEMGKKTLIRRLAKYLPLSVQKAVEIEAAVDAGYRVTLDRYGDVVIEGEAKPVAEGEDDQKSASKLERFEERHGTAEDGEVSSDPVPHGTEQTDDTQLRGATAERPGAAPNVGASPQRQGDLIPESPAAGAQDRKASRLSGDPPAAGEPWQKQFDALAPDPANADKAWAVYAGAAIAAIKHAGSTDLANLRLTNNRHMQELRKVDGDLYREITAAVTNRVAELRE